MLARIACVMSPGRNRRSGHLDAAGPHERYIEVLDPAVAAACVSAFDALPAEQANRKVTSMNRYSWSFVICCAMRCYRSSSCRAAEALR